MRAEPRHSSTNESGADWYQDTIRAVVRGGGCNCSRGNYAGALLGAARGTAVIPGSWLARVNQTDTIVDTLLSAANIVRPRDG